MNIEYYHYPFYHVIIKNIFSDSEYSLLQNEIDNIIDNTEYDNKSDTHHSLLKLSGTKSWHLDVIFKDNRSSSLLLNATGRFTTFPFKYSEFPFATLLEITNLDESFLHLYENDSYYFKHRDGSYLTFLFNLWKNSDFEGGEICFSDYNYTPELDKNSLIVFPGNVNHHVNPLKQLDDKPKRIVLNRRYFIRPT